MACGSTPYGVAFNSFILDHSQKKRWFGNSLELQYKQWRSQPDCLVTLWEFKSLSLFISLEIDSLYGL